MGILRSIAMILFLFFLFSTQNFLLSLGTNIICQENERIALLSFKQHLKNSSYSLSSWTGENCCNWVGVHCNNITHHVIQIHLSNLGLGGELSPSLQELKQLTHFDLSLNYFEGINIPDFLGSLQSLRYLNLSNADFTGMIPHQLGNLSNLHYLDLSSLYYDQIKLNVGGNLEWLTHLSSLKYLDLSYVNIENASNSNWIDVVNMLPSLLTLRLSNCGLSGAFPSPLAYVNFTSLAVLDLSDNNFNSTIPEWLFNLTNLQQLVLKNNLFRGTISASISKLTKLTLLDLSSNNFEGEITTALGNLTLLTVLELSYNYNLEVEISTAFKSLCKLQILGLSNIKLTGDISRFLESSTRCFEDSLEYLDLSSNNLSGPLPNELGRLQNLNYLSLKENSFSGIIPSFIGSLTSLRKLDLSYNQLNGFAPEIFRNLSKLESLILSHNILEFSEVHFSNLTSLNEIDLDSVVLKVRPEWIPPFQLQIAILSNCGLGPRFPNWIQKQKLLYILDLSSNGISGNVPTWFWNLSSQLSILNLSHNNFIGELPKVFVPEFIFLGSNKFKGPLPRLGSNVLILDISNNSISGPISSLLCNPPTEVNNLQFLYLSNNLLSGDLSHCWSYWRSLRVLMLGSNNITNKIPNSMGSLYQLESLHLQNNSLSGEIPSSFRNCTSLAIVDMGDNVLTGRLPIWLGESFQDLRTLRLRQNKFHGEIPQQLCHLISLQILDIAHNQLSGFIPTCFGNFSAMINQNWTAVTIYIFYSGSYAETTSLVTKGRELEYGNTLLQLVTNMDLSKNNLSGEIPEELTSLIGLRSLNLSENRLLGKIPEKIGNMVLLESLDFSNNNLSDVIPPSISNISSLSHLNVSYNKLSGTIPLGTQLQSFNGSSFIGNQDLCGLPLKLCNLPQKPDDTDDKEVEDEDEDWFEMKWFYMSMALGFIVGFWAFCGVIIVKTSWRIAYFRFIDKMTGKLCLMF